MDSDDDNVDTEPRGPDSDDENSIFDLNVAPHEVLVELIEPSLHNGWTKVEPPPPQNRIYTGSSSSIKFGPPTNGECASPMYWFKQFWLESFTRKIVAQTNLYYA